MEKAALAAGEKVKFLPFKDNLKHTFNLYAKYANFSSSVVFSDDGYAALYETFGVRDLTMHPKSYDTFSITDAQIRRVADANDWFKNAINVLISGHNQKLEKDVRARV